MTKLPIVSIEWKSDGSEEPAPPFDEPNTPKPMEFVVRRKGPLDQPLIVNFDTPTGTAMEESDYHTAPRQVTIPQGQSTLDLSIKIIWDDEEEVQETVQLVLSGPSSGSLPNTVNSASAYAVAQRTAEGKVADEFVPRMRDRLTQEEGKRNEAYTDTEDNVTVGIGHNMGPAGQEFRKEEFERVTGADYEDVKEGRAMLTDAQVEALFKNDLKKAVAQVKRDIANFDKLPLDAKEALTDMVFNLGSLTAFNDLKEAIGRRDWKQAAWDIGHKTRAADSPPSTYFEQVPNRAQRNIDLMNKVAAEAGQ